MKARQMENKELIVTVKQYLKKERELKVEIIVLLSEIWARKLFFPRYRDFSDFCIKELGMSKNQAWQRSQIARSVRYFPELLDLVKSGETSMTNIRLAATKVTKANFELVKEGIKGKSKRQAELFLSTVTPDGKRLPKEETIELRLDLPRSTLEKLERAKQVLASRGKNLKTLEVLDEALEALLEKKDPLRKAERAHKRMAKRDLSDDQVETPPIEQGRSPSDTKKNDRYIPASMKHEVYIRDQGRCTHVDERDGRCEERSMLELDHIKMHCRGGKTAPDNLRLLCRRHNQNLARAQLGDKYMDRRITAPEQPRLS